MEALGTVETVGLVAAIEAADVACKTANVRLVGYELARGGGYVTIKVLGKVGAVNAAVAAAIEGAGRLSCVVSSLVIPRPNEQVEPLVFNSSTKGYEPPAPATTPSPAPRKVTAAKAANDKAPTTTKRATTHSPTTK